MRPTPPFRAFREDTLEKAQNAGVRGKWATMALLDAKRGYLIYRVNEADSIATRATALGSLILSQQARLVGLVWQEQDTLHAFIAAPGKMEHWEAAILSKKRGDIDQWSRVDEPSVLSQAARLALDKVNPEVGVEEIAR